MRIRYSQHCSFLVRLRRPRVGREWDVISGWVGLGYAIVIVIALLGSMRSCEMR